MRHQFLAMALLFTSFSWVAMNPAAASAQRSKVAKQSQAERVLRYQQASGIAMNLIHGCYDQENPEACAKLLRAKSIILNWCMAGEVEGCNLARNIEALESTAMIGQTIR